MVTLAEDPNVIPEEGAEADVEDPNPDDCAVFPNGGFEEDAAMDEDVPKPVPLLIPAAPVLLLLPNPDKGLLPNLPDAGTGAGVLPKPPPIVELPKASSLIELPKPLPLEIPKPLLDPTNAVPPEFPLPNLLLPLPNPLFALPKPVALLLLLLFPKPPPNPVPPSKPDDEDPPPPGPVMTFGDDPKPVEGSAGAENVAIELLLVLGGGLPKGTAGAAAPNPDPPNPGCCCCCFGGCDIVGDCPKLPKRPC